MNAKYFFRKYYRYFLLAAAVLACLYGAVSGEPDTVFQKAAAICLECIGIG